MVESVGDDNELMMLVIGSGWCLGDVGSWLQWLSISGNDYG